LGVAGNELIKGVYVLVVLLTEITLESTPSDFVGDKEGLVVLLVLLLLLLLEVVRLTVLLKSVGLLLLLLLMLFNA
jgi:hypothetical protein